MPSLHDTESRQEIVERIRRLTPQNDRLWGQMDHARMLAHVADQLRMALGDLPVERASGPLRFAPTRFLIVHVLPWPKGKAQAPPEAFTTPPAGWEADKMALLELIERFAATPAAGLQRINPIFGRMSGKDWGVLAYRHLNHHLTQFSA